ncbi:MAG TPA: OB-fold nucleic acid binding domain-containing protein, partial [Acidimicrobiales bacterium]
TPDDLRAVHFAIDPQAADELRVAWAAAGMTRVALELVACPDRRLTRAAVELVARDLADGDTEVSVLLPDRKYTGMWRRVLHDRTADAIERAVSQLAHANVTTVPFHFGRGDGLGPESDRHVVAPRPPRRPRGRGVAAPGGAPADGDGSAHRTGPLGNGDRGPGVTPIGQVRWRRRVAVEGTVATVRVVPTAGGHLLECVLDDGTGAMSLVFNGRREISGMGLGARVRAEGAAATHRGRLALYNPVYTLLVAR